MNEYIKQRQLLGRARFAGPILLHWSAERIWSGLEIAGTGSWTADMSSLYSMSKESSLYLKTADASIDDQDVESHLLIYEPPHGTVELSVPWLFPTMTGSIYWYWSLQIIHATPDHNCLAFTLLYIWPLWWYVGTTVSEAMSWSYIDGSDEDLAPETWHKTRLRVDYNLGKYVDFSTDSQTFDLSDIDPVDIYYSSGADNRDLLVLLFSVGAYGGFGQPPTEMYFDEITFFEE